MLVSQGQRVGYGYPILEEGMIQGVGEGTLKGVRGSLFT